jgi:hypothetical protein
MHLILRSANGRIIDALLLTMTADAMRVIVHDCNETLEYRRVADRWVGDDGASVSIEAMLPPAALQPVGARGLTLSAGS